MANEDEIIPGVRKAPDILNGFIEQADQGEDGRGRGQMPRLSPEQEAAREEGYTQSRLGVVRTQGDYVKPQPKLRVREPRVSPDGTVNATAEGEPYLSDDAGTMGAEALYRRTLGTTKYADLKRRCGIGVDGSFTDWYNAGGVVPDGFEKEARLLLAEERRMHEYARYEAGEISETDFLYRAYGKDLLEEAGYYLDSSLWWYNRHKSGDHTNPLDSDAFLSSVIENARTVWQAESWYKSASEKRVGDTLAGYVTGQWLSDGQFAEAFSTQVEALKPYFNDSVSKILAYYKAGYLGSAFSPFIDVDKDGEYDYYFHTDGRMYAVEGSSGVGNAKCSITYNDDKSVHAVQIRDGFDGPVDSFLEGFRDFWVGFLDLGSMVVSLFDGIRDAANGGTYWVDSQARWEAFKKSTWALGDNDYVTFDGSNPWDGTWNADDWSNNVCRGVGTVAGMVALAVLTYGASVAAQGAKAAAEVGAKAGAEAAATVGKNASKEAITQAYKTAVRQVTANIGKEATKKQLTVALNAMGKEFSRQLIANGVAKGVAKEVVKGAMKGAVRTAITSKALSAITRLTAAGMKARSGFVISAKGVLGSVWGQSVQIAATAAVKDFFQVWGSLTAKNQALKYLEDATDGQITALSDGDILGRAFAVAGADLVVSSMFRATGKIGITTRFSRGGTEAAKAAFRAATPASRIVLANMSKHMVARMAVDNAADIFENITTMGIQAAMSNPYARTGEQMWTTAIETAFSPSSILTNLYIGIQNGTSYFQHKSMAEDRMADAIEAFNLDAGKTKAVIPNLITKINAESSDPADADTVRLLRSVQGQIDSLLASDTPDSKTYLDNVIEANRLLDDLLSDASDDKLMAALNLNKDQLAQVKSAMRQLNAEGEVSGICTASVFRDAKLKNFRDNVAIFEDLVNQAQDMSARRSSIRQAIWRGLGKLPFIDENKAKSATNAFGQMIDSLAKRQRLSADYSWDSVIRQFVARRLATLDYDESKDQDVLNLFQDPNSGIALHELSVDSVLPNARLRVDVDEQGMTKLSYLTTDGKPLSDADVARLKDANPLLSLFDDYSSNKEAIGRLSYVFQQVGTTNLYDILSDGTPWFAIGVDPGKRNQLLRDPNAMRLINALETVSLLFEDGSGFDGFPLADYEVDMVVKVEVPYKNSAGETTTRTIYVIPNGKGTTQLDLVNRLHVAQSLVYGVAKIQAQLNRNDVDPEAYVKELTKLGILLDQDAAFNGTEEFEKAWQDAAKRDALTKEFMRKSAMALLVTADFSSASQDEKAGIGRRQLINLYKKGILSDELLTDLAASSGNPRVEANIKAMRQYLDMDKRLTECDASLYFALAKGQSLTLNEYRKVESVLRDLNSDDNADLRKFLDEDGRIRARLKSILDNPRDFLNFGTGLSRDSADRLTRSGSSAEASAESDEDLRRLLVGLASQTIGKAKKAASGFATLISEARGESRKAMISSDDSTTRRLDADERLQYIQSSVLEKGFGAKSPNEFADAFNARDDSIYDSSSLRNLLEIEYGSADGFEMEERDGMLYLKSDGRQDQSLVEYLSSFDKAGYLVNDETFAESKVNRLFEMAGQYDEYLNKNTEVTKAERVVTVDLYEIVPQAMRSAVIAMQQSEQARNQLSRVAQMQEDDLIRLKDRIIGGGSASSQLISWNKLLSEYSGTDGLLRFDLDDPAQMQRFREVMQRLGYESDIQRVLSGQEAIEGISLYDRDRHSVSVKGGSAIRDAFMSFGRAAMARTSKQKDFGEMLRYSIACAQRLDPNAKLHIPLLVFGVARSTDGMSFVADDGKTYYERNTKGNLQASEAAKANAFVYTAIGVDSGIDERSANTFNLYRAVSTVFGYAKSSTEYQSEMAIPYSDKLWKAISDFYSKSKYSIIEPSVVGDASNKNRTIVFYFKPGLGTESNLENAIMSFIKHATTEGFDIRELIPIWGSNVDTVKSKDFAMSEQASAETVVSVLLQSKIDGFMTTDDLKALAQEKVQPSEYYVFDEDEFASFRDSGDFTFSKLLDLVNSEAFVTSAKTNYFTNLLRYQVLAMAGMDAYVREEFKDDPTALKISDRKATMILGDLLAKQEYAPILNGSADEGLRKRFADEYNSLYAGYEYDQVKSFSDDAALYQSDFTSTGIWKFSPSNDDAQSYSLTADDVSNISGMVASFRDSYVATDRMGVPLHSSLRTSLSFAKFGEDGSLRVHMEDYIRAPKADREAFISFVNEEVIGNAKGLGLDDEAIKGFKALVKTLEEKNRLIDDMDANKGISTLDQASVVRIEPTMPGQPSVAIDPTYAFATGNGRKAREELAILSRLAANRSFASKGESKFIRSSALDLGRGFLPDDVNSIMAALLKNTSYSANDKTGSVMVYNLRSAEGAGEFLMQIRSFADEMIATFKDNGKADLSSDPEFRKALVMAGMQLSMYTTGATFAAEYAGSMVLQYDTNTKAFTIKPINVSVNSPEESTYAKLIYADGSGIDLDSIRKAHEKGIRTILFKADKNAFVNNASGYAADFDVFDLDDEGTMESILRDALVRAKYGMEPIRASAQDDMRTDVEILNAYYGQRVRYNDVRSNIIEACRQIGIPDSVVGEILPTVTNMSVMQATKLRDQKLLDFAHAFIDSIKPLVPNNQIAALEDALLFGVTYSSIGIDGRIALENADNRIRNAKIDSLRAIDKDAAKQHIVELDDIVSGLLDPSTEARTRQAMASLSDDDKAYVVKRVMLGRKRGRDLAAMLSSVSGDLGSYFSKVQASVDDDSLDWDSDSTNNPNGMRFSDVLSKKAAFYDTEWLYKEGSDDRMFYQFAYVIRDPNGNVEKHCVLVRESLFAKQKGDSWIYEEGDEGFGNKVQLAKEIGVGTKTKDGVRYTVVNTAAEAVEAFASAMKADGVEVRIAYNNRAEGSDDSWFGLSAKATSDLKGIANLDLREDGVTKIYTDELASLNTESLDSLREAGIIKTGSTTEAHDALSDAMDLIGLYDYLEKNGKRTSYYYTSLKTYISDITGLKDKDLDAFLSKVSFGEIALNSDLRKALEGVDSLQKGNPSIKRVLDAFATSYEYQSKREGFKALRNAMDDVLNPVFGGTERKAFVDFAHSDARRSQFSSTFMAVFYAKGGNANDVSLGGFDALRKSFDTFTKAFEIYKNGIDQTYMYEHLSLQRLYERFLTLPDAELKRYLAQADPSLKEKLELSDGSTTRFSDEQFRKIQTDFDFLSSYEDELRTNAYNRILNPVASIVYGRQDPDSGYERVQAGDVNLFGDDGIMTPALRDRVFHVLTHVYGANAETESAMKGRTRQDRLSRKNLLSDGFSQDVIDFLQDDVFGKNLSSHLAAWRMAQEKREFVKGEGEFGVLYVGRNVLEKMDGFKINPETGASYAKGDTFYSMMWRQPGQQSTVMHVMKVVVTDTRDEFSMTRTTAKTYFNGDFDGDFFYLTPPDEQSKAYGSAMFSALTQGGSMLDALATDAKARGYGRQFDAKPQDSENGTAVFNGLTDDQCRAILAHDRRAILDFNVDMRLHAREEFAISLHEYKHGANVLTCQAPFLAKFVDGDGPKAELAKALLQGNQAYLRNNILDDNYIDTVFGVMSKNVKGKLAASENLADLTYVSTLAVPEESQAFLMQLCHNLSAKQKSDIKASMMDSLSKSHLTSDEIQSIGAAIDGALALPSKTKFAEIAERLITIAKVAQILELRSDGFSSALNGVSKSLLTERTSELASKVEGAFGMLNKLGYDVGELSDEDRASGPRLLMRMSEAFEKVNGRNRIRNAIAYSDRDGAVATRLFADFLTKANVEARSNNGVEVISSSDYALNVPGKGSGFKGVGLAGDVYIAVKDSDDRTDTAVLVKKGASKLRISHLYKTVDTRDMTPKDKSAMFALLSHKGPAIGTVSGKTIARIMGAEYVENPSSRYSMILVDNAGNVFDPTKDSADSWMNRNCRLVVSEMTNLYDSGMSKVGLTGTKNMKVTLSREPGLEFGKTKNGNEIALMVTQGKLDYTKQSAAGSVFEPTGERIKDGNGESYSVVKVNDMALLSLLDQNESYVSMRGMDPISILCGSRGADAMLSYGEMFFSFDGEKFEYNPNGYNSLRASVAQPNANRLEDVNGADMVRVMRIATYLSVMSGEAQMRFLSFLQKCGIQVANPQAAIEELASRQDVGGLFGGHVEGVARKIAFADGAEPKLNKLLGNPANVWQRTVFSDEVSELLSSDMDSRAEDDGKPLPGKKDKLRGNRRTLSMMKQLNDFEELLRYEGATQDMNGTTFIPRKALLRIALDMAKTSDEDVGLITTTLKDMFSSGMVQPESIVGGNRYNNYHSILSGQGRYVPKSDDDRVIAQMKKSGAYANMEDSSRITETASLLNLPMQSASSLRQDISAEPGLDMISRFSPYDRAMSATDDEQGAKWNAYRRNKYGNMTNTHVMALLSNGSDEQIYDALTGYRGVFEMDRATPYPTLSQSGDGISLTPRIHGMQTLETAEAAKDAISEKSKSPKLERLRQKNLLNMRNALSMDKLEGEDPGVVLELLSQRSLSSSYEEATASIMRAIEEYKDESPMSSLRQGGILANERESIDKAHLLKMAALSSDDNGIEFVSSAFRSWGFKSDDAADIPLGQRVVNMSSVASNYAEQLLGKDFLLLSHMVKADRDAVLLFEECMKMTFVIDSYDDLVSDKQNHVKRLGQTGYDEAITEAIQAAGGDIEAMRRDVDARVNSNASVSVMFDAARAITARVMEEAKRQNPYSIAGWYVTPPSNEKKPFFAKFGTYMNVYRFGREANVSTMLEEGFGKGSKITSALYGENTGFIGNILRVANDLAKKKALDDLSSYMRSNGYMSNAKLFGIGESVLDSEFGAGFAKTFDEIYGDLGGNPQRRNSFENDAYTYGVLSYTAVDAGVNVKPGYDEPSDFLDLYRSLGDAWKRASDGMSFEEYLAKWQDSKGDDRAQYDIGLRIYNAYMSTVSTMVAMLSEREGGKPVSGFLTSVYDRAMAEINRMSANGDSFVLVDKNGAMLMPKDKDRGVPVYSQFDIDGMVKAYKFGGNMSDDQKKQEIAKMILTGDAYLMRSSLAEQLDKKVFTAKQHGLVHQVIRKTKSIATSLIMVNPMQLLDRLINFPMFDIGVDAGGDWRTLGQTPTALATVTKLVALGDNLKQEDIDADPNLQYLVRFLAASNQDLLNSTSVRGEKVGTTNIPLVKQYIKLANLGFNIGNTVPRFAYYLNIVKDAEANGYKIDPVRMGVAFHLQEGIDKLTGRADDEIYGRYGDNAQAVADLDAKAIQVIAEHNGFEGNMPYFAKYLNENYNTMFLSFPMTAVRWGVNRVQSLAYAFMTMAESSASRKYLLNQVGSVAITQAILLGLQLLLSSQTREWMKKKATGKDDEITEEEQEAAENILFRGGCVKIFETIRDGQEVTTTSHNRGPASALFDSYLADFIPATNGGKAPDFNTFWYALMNHTWGHAPSAVKDIVESIPGNAAIQSTSWAEPGDNFLENYGRKVVGYALGSQQANAVFDYYKSADKATDDGFMQKLANGMRYAYATKFANTKDSKSNWKNYRKAFSMVYDYKKMQKTLDSSDYQLSDKSAYSTLKSDLLAAIKTQNNLDSIMTVIQKAREGGMSLSTIRSALRTCSLKQQLLSMGDYQTFIDSLSDSERSVIKSALIYEDKALPYIDDAWSDIEAEYDEQQRRARIASGSKYPTVSEAVRQRRANIKTGYGSSSYNSNYNYLRNTFGNGSYSNHSNPMDAYNNLMKTWKYGMATDIYGNRYSRYTNSSGDTWKYGGNS